MTNLPINDDLRQHISLSTFAYNTLMADITSYNKKGTETLSGIANIIICNYFDESFASISRNEENEKYELDNLIKSKHYAKGSIEEAAANTIRDELVKRHRNELTKKMNSYSKDHNIKIRLQKRTIELLENECIEDIDYYSTSLTGYLKALLEDYAHQNNYNRTRIIYKDIIDHINSELLKAEYGGELSKVLRISFIDFHGNQLKDSAFVKPYRLTREDEYNGQLMLLCKYCYPYPDGSLPPYENGMIPLHLISGITPAAKRYGSAKLTKVEKKSLEETVKDHVHFNPYESKKIVVSLSEDALAGYYLNNTPERPSMATNRIRITGSRRFIAEFYCPIDQGRAFFNKFGSGAIILAPKDCTDAVLWDIKKSLYLYNANENKLLNPQPNLDVEKDIEDLLVSEKNGRRKGSWNYYVHMYSDPLNGGDNLEKELLFYQKTSELGFELANVRLGNIYFENEFVVTDYQKAAYYYEKAFNNLSPYEKANYASILINGLYAGHTADEGWNILEKIKNSSHKEHIKYITPEGYTFYSYAYEKGYLAPLPLYPEEELPQDMI